MWSTAGLISVYEVCMYCAYVVHTYNTPYSVQSTVHSVGTIINFQPAECESPLTQPKQRETEVH